MNTDLVSYGDNIEIENKNIALEELMKHYFDMENADKLK
jgi:hypothetical protein